MASHAKRKSEEKPQYYYLYGSIEATNATTSSEPASPAGGNNTDEGSLVGESLIPTDNEGDEETPLNEAKDRSHVLLMSGNEIKPLVGSPPNGHHSQRGLCQRLSFSFTSFKERHPIVHISLLGAVLSLFLFVCSAIFFPGSRAASVASTPESELRFKVPFPIVDRSAYNDPVSAFLVKELIDPKLLYQGRDRSRLFQFPFPTGAFWTNLVLPPTADRGLSYPITVYPYGFKWSDDIIQVSYPAAHREEKPREIHDYFFPDLSFSTMEGNGQRYISSFDALSVTLHYNANTQSGAWDTYLVQGSPYVTMKYKNVSPVIHAFSIFKDVFCPRDEDASSIYFGDGSRRRLSFGVCSQETSDDGSTSTLRGVQFMIQTKEDMNWFVFASEPITLSLDLRSMTTIKSLQRFSGVLRFAVIPPPSPTEGSNSTASSNYMKISSSKGLQRLIYHAGVYPVSGSVSWSFRPAAASDASKTLIKSITGLAGLSTPSQAPDSSSTTSTTNTRTPRLGTIHFDFSTQTFAPTSSATGSKALLMLALPHHSQSLPSDVLLGGSKFNLVYKSIKGPMAPVLGSSWSYDEVLPSLGFDGDSGSNSMKPLQDPAVRAVIVKSLKEDIKLALPTMSENVYGFGKQAARLAQLAHIAYNLKEHSVSRSRNSTHSSNTTKSRDDIDDLSNVLSRATNLLMSSLGRFLSNNVSDVLLFDGNLGGLVTSDGLYDSSADFGNGRYNDHHFHYGYLLYACAIMGKLNATFIEHYGDFVDGIYYDIAHSDNFDSSRVDGVFFPGSRHKVWFDGHSFASGLFPFANGKSQESSSEAVNGYYGAYLWSLVRHDGGYDPTLDTSAQTDFARLLLATEIRGAQTYWQISPVDDSSGANVSAVRTYSQQFSKNYMVGNLGMTDVVCSTWFGTDPLYVHMINFIPVTAVTGELFRRSYVMKEISHALRPADKVEMAWRGYVVADAAIVDPLGAWQDAQGLFSPELDSGLSKSQVLYWIATRAGFDPSQIPVGPNTTDSSGGSGKDGDGGSHEDSTGKSSCQVNGECAATGLTGDCCPTPEGTFLDCCGSS